MDDRERQRLLHEAIGDAVSARKQTEAEERNARRARERRRSPAVLWTTIIVGWAVRAWIWIGRPAWLFDDTPERAESAEVSEARLRFALYLERNRVDQFRRRTGRLPATLEEAGSVEEGITYLPRGRDSFAVEGSRGGTTLLLTSAMDSDSFLGGSRTLIPVRKQP